MNTRCELQFFNISPTVAEHLAKDIRRETEYLSQRYNFHSSQSWLSTCVNQRKSNTVEIDEEFAKILRIVHAHSLLTKDAFDITAGTYAKQLARAKTISEANSIYTRLSPYTGSHLWRLEHNILHFTHAITQFDLGGVMKEYAVDKAMRLSYEAGVHDAVINFGGDMFVLGMPNNTGCMVAIPHPQQPQRALIHLELANQAISTSAHYFQQRKLALQGKNKVNRHFKTLSHIPNRANFSLDNDINLMAENASEHTYLSASVVSPNTVVSGIYSTALLVNAKIALPNDCTAFMVDNNAHIYTQNGALVEKVSRESK